MRRMWIAAAAMVAVLLGGAAGAWVYLGAVSPEEAVAKVVDKLESVSSYRFKMTGSLESAGQSMDMDFEGSAQESGDLADARLQMAGTVGLMGQSIGMSEVMLDGKLYLKYDEDPLGASGQWYWMDYDLSGVQSMQSGNPSEYLQYMEAYSTVEEREDATIDGVDCRHYYLTIDSGKVADMAASNYEKLAGQLPQGAAAFDVDQLREIYAGSDITMDVFIDKDSGMPRRQVLWLELASDTPVTVEMTIDLFDFNKPVSVEAPAGAVPLPTELGGA